MQLFNIVAKFLNEQKQNLSKGRLLINALDLSHRGQIRVDHLVPNPSLISRLGGRLCVDRIVDGLYDRLEQDTNLRPMFRRDLQGERDKQKDFWEEWFGGQPNYTTHHAYNGLRLRHSGIHITRESAQNWLEYFEASLSDNVSDPALRMEIRRSVRPIAMSFVNEKVPPGKLRDLRCYRENACKVLKKIAQKGDTAGVLSALLEKSALLEDQLGMAEVLQGAVMSGRTETVLALMGAGLDPNTASPFKDGCIFQNLMLTPLCLALGRGHSETAEALKASGAVYDIFSAAYLGDLQSVDAMTGEHPSLVQMNDPANDILETTPLHHAVYGGHLKVVDLLFKRRAEVGKNSAAMVRHAANRGHSELVKLLLVHGADGTHVGPGLWVTNPDISSALRAAGADVNYPHGEWIWRTCTGNNSQRDNPVLLKALLDHGADIAMRLRGATALHYASKAGFLESIRLLIEYGANPNMPDDAGETPLFYAFKAGKRAMISTVCEILLSAGADPEYPNKKGCAPMDVASRSRREDRIAILAVLQAHP